MRCAAHDTFLLSVKELNDLLY